MFALRADPLLGPRVAERPGLRIPGEWDPFECAVGAILRAEDQDAVQTLMARVVDRFADKISKPGSALTSLFPTPKAIANGNFAGLGLSRSTVNTLRKHRRHFYFGIADGVKAGFMHFRRCDQRLNLKGGRKTASAYDAIGAAQVAKASFAGMRFLHHLGRKVAIWPMDPLPEHGSAVVEIYTRIYLRRAGLPGTKLRSRAALNQALKGLGSPPARLRFEPSDHQTDALVTAAGMRQFQLTERCAFDPEGLTPQIARTEGWTFGVL